MGERTDSLTVFQEIRQLLHGEDNPVDKTDTGADAESLKQISDLFHQIKIISLEAEDQWIYDLAYKTAHFIDLIRTSGSTFDRAKLVVIEDCRDLLTHYIDGVETDPGSLEDWYHDLAESIRVVDDNYMEKESPGRYHITVDFDIDSFSSDFDPIYFIEEIASYGDLVERKIHKEKLPSFEELDPQQCFVSWSCIIDTHYDYRVFEDIFIKREHRGKYSIEKMQSIENIDHGTIEKVESNEENIPVQTSPDRVGHVHQPVSVQTTHADGVVVDSKRLDELMNLLGEIVIGHSAINRFAEGLDAEASSELTNAMYGLDRTTREFQEQLMAIRTVQMDEYIEQLKTFVKMKAEEHGRNIDVTVSGHETELDRSMIERILAPVRELISYAVACGIENPAERKKTGKDETAHVEFNAYHQEGSVILSLSDDGKGFDPSELKKQAEEAGLVKKGEDVPKGRLFSLLLNGEFASAFYREFGLSGQHLKEVVENLRGTVDIESAPGKGTTFKIKLPLSLAIIEGMAVRVGEHVYIVPLLSIVESIQPREADVKTIEGKGEVIQARGEYIALVRLYEYYNIKSDLTNPWESLVVIVESNGEKVGLMVDDLIGQQQTVIKNIGSDLASNRSISGASILGDGRISLIIDIHGLVEEITV
jgi:two-component system chemotaxis sensor kinase CheA